MQFHKEATSTIGHLRRGDEGEVLHWIRPGRSVSSLSNVPEDRERCRAIFAEGLSGDAGSEVPLGTPPTEASAFENHVSERVKLLIQESEAAAKDLCLPMWQNPDTPVHVVGDVDELSADKVSHLVQDMSETS